MSIWLTYTLKTLLLPQSSLWFGALLGGYWLLRGRKIGWYLLSAVLGSWYILSTPAVARALLRSLEHTPPLQIAQLAAFKPQAIVVLAGGLHFFAPEYPAPNVTLADASLQRLRYAARLAKLTQLPVLVSGGKVLEQNQPAEADVMALTLLEDYGLHARWRENSSRNTAENAKFSAALLQAQQIERLILVTSALHMPRALAAFEQTGLDCLAAPTHYLADETPYDILSFLPAAKAFNYSNMALHEYLGRLWHWFKLYPIDSVTN